MCCWPRRRRRMCDPSDPALHNPPDSANHTGTSSRPPWDLALATKSAQLPYLCLLHPADPRGNDHASMPTPRGRRLPPSCESSHPTKSAKAHSSYTGVVVDSRWGTLSIPPDKMAHLAAFLDFVHCREASLRHSASLRGRIQHYSVRVHLSAIHPFFCIPHLTRKWL